MVSLGKELGAFVSALRGYPLWMMLGWVDVQRRYARSALGPFWITITMGVMIGSIALVYGTLLSQRMRDYLPLVGCGIVVWGLISGVLNDACVAYTNNVHYIKQSDVGLWVYVLQAFWRQAVMFAHNMVIVVVLLLVYGTYDVRALLGFVPGCLLLAINLLWMAQLVALGSARFRDVPQLVAAALQMLFYVTPLMWSRSMLGRHAQWVWLNPFAALVDIVRAPLLGSAPDAVSWAIAAAMAPLGWVLALWAGARVSHRVAYWV